MSDGGKYTIKSVEVHLTSGVTIAADVDSLEGVKLLINDIDVAKLGQTVTVAHDLKKHAIHPAAGLPDEPVARMETRAGLKSGSLAKASVLAIKDQVPQLLRPNSFKNVTDAVLVLIYAIETGLGRNPIDYDSFNALFDAQNLKSGSPLSMMLTNLRNAGYLDKNVYANGRNIRLTAKGETKAIEVIAALCEGA